MHAVHPTFGASSYDCQPAALLNPALRTPLTLGNSPQSLPFADACDAPLGFLDCACGGCQNDPTLACRTDADCPIATGPCNAAGGKSRQPNNCSDLVCTAAGGEEGVCMLDSLTFCDGITQADGRGIVECLDDSTCSSYGPQWGTCTIEELKSCFLDPIDAAGASGQAGGVLVSTACVAPSGDLFTEGVFGFPGPVRMQLGVDQALLCSDGTTPYVLGGGTCSP